MSGWQIWSDATGSGAPDGPQDGLYHTFPPGTVLDTGKTLHIVNEYSGTPPADFQEAREGGLESEAGGTNTNFLSEGSGNTSAGESVALVNPATGEYIIINMATGQASTIPRQSGFPGTTNVGTSNAASDSGQEDQNAGSSYQYNSSTDSYDYANVFVACFAAGTRIATPTGDVAVEDLVQGDLLVTLDHGARPIRLKLHRTLDFESGDDPCHKPIEIKAHAFGHDRPYRPLIVSPQHRMLVNHDGIGDVLVPAKGLTSAGNVRVMSGRWRVIYIHLVLERHEVIMANGCWSESFYPGQTAISGLHPVDAHRVLTIFPDLGHGALHPPARPLRNVEQTRRMARAAFGKGRAGLAAHRDDVQAVA